LEVRSFVADIEGFISKLPTSLSMNWGPASEASPADYRGWLENLEVGWNNSSEDIEIGEVPTYRAS
jgi:hypothetical protein